MGSFSPIHIIVLIIAGVLFLLARMGLISAKRGVERFGAGSRQSSQTVRIEGLNDSGRWGLLYTTSNNDFIGHTLDQEAARGRYRSVRAITEEGLVLDIRQATGGEAAGASRRPLRTEDAIHRDMDRVIR